MSDDPRPECDVETSINRLPIRAGSPMSRLFPPCAVPLLAVLLIALVAPQAASAATDSAEATWRGEWRPTEGCASRKTRPLTITVEGEKVIGRIGTAGSFVASMDGTGRVIGRGVTDDDMAFNVRGRRQGERIGGRFTGFYDEGERQCDGVFEVTLVPPPEPPAAAVAPSPPEPQVVVPEPEPEPEPAPTTHRHRGAGDSEHHAATAHRSASGGRPGRALRRQAPRWRPGVRSQRRPNRTLGHPSW